MLLATIVLLSAATARFPFDDMSAPVFGSMFSISDLCVDLFLVPMIVWDLVSRGRVHVVTLLGGLGIIASQPLQVMLSETSVWLSFASWAVVLLGK
jgi:hypothetical protein